MIPQHIHDAIDQAMRLLPERMDTPAARVMLLAIGLQESGFKARRQMDGGPARGYWQFERGGGVLGVMGHRAVQYLAQDVCRARGVEWSTGAVHDALEHDDVLAAAFARLLLWTDPKPLPAIGNPQEAWALYDRAWRPGKPRPEHWRANYTEAVRSV